jgi:hypothetical protein
VGARDLSPVLAAMDDDPVTIFPCHFKAGPAGGGLRRPSSAADNRGKLIDRHSFGAQHYAAHRGRISVEGVK